MSLLIREIGALYASYSGGRPSPLAELAIQYADYAAWQREWLSEKALVRQFEYWSNQLEGAPPVLDLPTARPRPLAQSFRGEEYQFFIPEDVFKSLQELSRREGLTVFMTLLAGFQILLSRYSGQDDIVLGTPIAARNRVEIEGLIGFFVNTLVMRDQAIR